MRITILGGGSIGLHLAAQLSIAGHQITVVCRNREQARAIQDKGINYIGLDHSIQQIFVEVQSVDEWPQKGEWIFLTVKQTQILSTLPYLQKVDPKVPVLCFQNGLGHEELLKEHLPDLSLYYAITTEGAYREDFRSVQHTGRGQTYIGILERDQRLEGAMVHLIDALGNLSLSIQLERNMKERIWKKLVINSCINPLTALLKVTNGKLIENEFALKVMELLLEEAVKLAYLEGVQINSGFMQEIVNICRNTYHNRSSMLQDMEAGRETEIEFINGAIIRMAEQHGISVPAHSILVNLLMAERELL